MRQALLLCGIGEAGRALLALLSAYMTALAVSPSRMYAAAEGGFDMAAAELTGFRSTAQRIYGEPCHSQAGFVSGAKTG